jgi:peroxiredoxin Q/BCP
MRYAFLPAAVLLGFVLAAAAPCGSLRADYVETEKRVYLRPGDAAPAFAATDDAGKAWRSADHFGKRVVILYFYLGDFMPPCTKEALAIQKELSRLAGVGAEIVGVSGDEVANHQLFKKAHRLKFSLLSDPKGVLCREYGVAQSGGGEFRFKDREGKETTMARGITASRWLFVIGTDGRILHKNPAVDPANPLRTVWPVLRNAPRGPQLP